MDVVGRGVLRVCGIHDDESCDDGLKLELWRRDEDLVGREGRKL